MKYVNHHKNKNSLFIHSSISGLFSRGLPSAPILKKYYFDFLQMVLFLVEFDFPSHFLMLHLKDLKTWRVSVPRPQPQGRVGLNSSSSEKKKI